MLAAVFRGPNRMELEEVAVPQISKEDLLIRVKACAICGTDLRIYTGQKTKGVRTPSVLGHEIAGQVEDIGENVQGFKKGDRVAIAPVLPCGNCRYCKNNQENACLNRKGLGYQYNGGFAEYLKLPGEYLSKGNLFIIPEGISYQEACLAEPLGCVYNGSERSRIKINDTVVIIGAGPIGLMHLLLSKAKGSTTIIVSEPLPARRQMAKKSGANLVVNPAEEDLVKTVLEYTDGKRADVVILSIGITSLIDPALRLLKKGGILNLFAGFPKESEAVISPNIIHYDEVWVTGATACTRSQYEKSLDLISRRKIDLKPLISHTYPLAKIEEAFATVANGAGIKVIIKP